MSKRIFVYETEGQTPKGADDDAPQTLDFYTLMTTPMSQGRLEVKIAAQCNGTGKSMQEWISGTLAEMTSLELSVTLPAAEQVKLRDRITRHLTDIKFERPRRTFHGWWMILFFILGIAAGART